MKGFLTSHGVDSNCLNPKTHLTVALRVLLLLIDLNHEMKENNSVSRVDRVFALEYPSEEVPAVLEKEYAPPCEAAESSDPVVTARGQIGKKRLNSSPLRPRVSPLRPVKSKKRSSPSLITESIDIDLKRKKYERKKTCSWKECKVTTISPCLNRFCHKRACSNHQFILCVTCITKEGSRFRLTESRLDLESRLYLDHLIRFVRPE